MLLDAPSRVGAPDLATQENRGVARSANSAGKYGELADLMHSYS
jgi:hypothetical protein